MFSRSVLSDSLRPHRLQHTRLPRPHSLQEFVQTHVESVMPSNHLTLCHPLLLLPSVFLSIRVFPSTWAQQSNKNIQRTCWRALCLPKGPSLHGSHQAVGSPPPPDTPPPASIFGVLTLGEAGPPAGPHQRPAWRGAERPLDSWPLDLNKLSGHSGPG